MCKCNMVELTGLFTIAFATALALGHAPEAFHFKQNSMRQHLRECLEHGVITMFPYDKTRRGNKKTKNVLSHGVLYVSTSRVW